MHICVIRSARWLLSREAQSEGREARTGAWGAGCSTCEEMDAGKVVAGKVGIVIVGIAGNSGEALGAGIVYSPKIDATETGASYVERE